MKTKCNIGIYRELAYEKLLSYPIERQQPEMQEREPLKFSQEDRAWLDFPAPDPDSSR